MNEITDEQKAEYEKARADMMKEWREIQPKISEFCEKHQNIISGFTIQKISKYSIIPAEFGVGIYTNNSIKSNNIESS